MTDTLLLIEAEIPRLRRFARYLLREPDRADDLVQDTLCRAIDRLSTWEQGTNLRAWLFIIMRNLYINGLRRARRTPDSVAVAEDDAAMAVPGGQEARVAFIDLRSALQQLPEGQREILLLVVVEGFTYEEAAGILEVPLGTVRSRVARARTALRALLDGELADWAEAVQ